MKIVTTSVGAFAALLLLLLPSETSSVGCDSDPLCRDAEPARIRRFPSKPRVKRSISGSGRRRTSSSSGSASQDMMHVVSSLDSRIEAVLQALYAKIPVAKITIEQATRKENLDRGVLGLGNLLGSLGGMYLGSAGNPNLGRISFGANVQVLAQLLYGYGYWGPFWLVYEQVETKCGIPDMDAILEEYRFLTDMKANYGFLDNYSGVGDPRDQLTDINNPTVLSYYAVELNHDLKRALYCVTQVKGINGDALYTSTLIDLYTQLLTERITMTGEAMAEMAAEAEENKNSTVTTTTTAKAAAGLATVEAATNYPSDVI